MSDDETQFCVKRRYLKAKRQYRKHIDTSDECSEYPAPVQTPNSKLSFQSSKVTSTPGTSTPYSPHTAKLPQKAVKRNQSLDTPAPDDVLRKRSYRNEYEKQTIGDKISDAHGYYSSSSSNTNTDLKAYKIPKKSEKEITTSTAQETSASYCSKERTQRLCTDTKESNVHRGSGCADGRRHSTSHSNLHKVHKSSVADRKQAKPSKLSNGLNTAVLSVLTSMASDTAQERRRSAGATMQKGKTTPEQTQPGGSPRGNVTPQHAHSMNLMRGKIKGRHKQVTDLMKNKVAPQDTSPMKLTKNKVTPQRTQPWSPRKSKVTPHSTHPGESVSGNISGRHLQTLDTPESKVTPQNTLPTVPSNDTVTPQRTHHRNLMNKVTPQRSHTVDSPRGTVTPQCTHTIDSPRGTATPQRTHTTNSPRGNVTPQSTHTIDSPLGTATPQRTHTTNSPRGNVTPQRTQTRQLNSEHHQTASQHNVGIKSDSFTREYSWNQTNNIVAPEDCLGIEYHHNVSCDDSVRSAHRRSNVEDLHHLSRSPSVFNNDSICCPGISVDLVSETREVTDMEVDFGFDIEQCSDIDGMGSKCTYIVIDTNVFLNNLRLLQKLNNQQFCDVSVVLFIPWVVIQELDGLKKNNSSREFVQKVSEAVRFINTHLKQKGSRLKGQSPAQSNAAHKVSDIQADCNDDRILQCCQQAAQSECSVILLTGDNNLSNKALIAGIAVHNEKTILDHLSGTDVTNGGPCGGNNNNNDGKPPADFTSTIVELEDVLRTTFSHVFSAEMVKVYGEIWLNLIDEPPPWNLNQILKYIDKYWNGVFGFLFPRTKNHLINDLRKQVYNKNDLRDEFNSMQCEIILDLSTEICEMMEKHKKYSGMEKCVDCIKALRKSLKSESVVQSASVKINDSLKESALNKLNILWSSFTEACTLSNTITTRNTGSDIRQAAMLLSDLHRCLKEEVAVQFHAMLTIPNDNSASMSAESQQIVQTLINTLNLVANQLQLESWQDFSLAELLHLCACDRTLMLDGFQRLQSIIQGFCDNLQAYVT